MGLISIENPLRVIVPMIMGFNSDVRYNDKVYHVQTEDVGGEDPYSLTLLYQGGAIIARIKTRYRSLSPHPLTEHQTQYLMQRQHQKMISDLCSGKFAPVTGVETERPSPPEAPPPEKTFDQLVLDYLANQDPSPENL